MRTYDIINAGQHGRFAANGRIVSNSGSIVQLQNLYRNNLTDLEHARELVKLGDYEALSVLYGSVPEVLAQCVRTAFIPQPGMKFIVADFSAIEARVVAWLAGEDWKVAAFRDGKDIYCETASKMFHKPVVKHGENGELRQLGKLAELACSYGGSVGALKAFGAIENGVKEEELQPIVTAWREANSNIVSLWWDVEQAAKRAIRDKTISKSRDLIFSYQGGMMYISLPSGRRLSYVRPAIGSNRFGGESITYMGMDITKHWGKIETFGGKLVENCIAKGTLVVTDRGLIPIELVTQGMKVWDGQRFVSHNGTVYKGVQETIEVSGVSMTPDHKILTEQGWKECGKSAGRYWADVDFPYERLLGKKMRSKKILIHKTALSKPVYDLLNAGSEHRFAVWNGKRAMIVSNCVQAISRDILCHAMNQLRSYRICAHVHDEVIIECSRDTSVDKICALMATVPDWAEGLPLRADGYECDFYRKD